MNAPLASTKPGSPTVVGVLGVGRFGSALERGLKSLGLQVHPRRKTDIVSLEKWLAQCQLICLCVRDDQIEQMVSELTACQLGRKTVLMHAGAVPLSVLAPLEAQGAVIGKFHPLMSFSEPHGDGIPKGTPFAFEGEIKALVAPWVRGWGGHLHRVEGDQWAVYHLAAVLAANFLPLFIRGGANLLKELTAGDLQKALNWLEPLVQASVANAMKAQNETPFSGPAVRGDREVLEKQQAFLATRSPQWHDVYASCSKLIQKIAAQTKL